MLDKKNCRSISCAAVVHWGIFSSVRTAEAREDTEAMIAAQKAIVHAMADKKQNSEHKKPVTNCHRLHT